MYKVSRKFRIEYLENYELRKLKLCSCPILEVMAVGSIFF